MTAGNPTDLTPVYLTPVAKDGSLLYYQGWVDAPTCPCGNTTDQAGFINLEADLTVSNINADAHPTMTRTLCLDCGRVYTNAPSLPRLVEGSGSFWAGHHTIGQYVTTFTPEQVQAALVQFEAYAG